MKKWGYAVISMGCVVIASAPLTDQNGFMILLGLVIVVTGLCFVVQKKKN